MPKAPRTPNFAALVKKLKGKQSIGQFATKIRPHVAEFGLSFDRSQITKLLEGRRPSMEILTGFSRAFRIPFEELKAGVEEEIRAQKRVTRADSSRTKVPLQKNSDSVTPSGSPSGVERLPSSTPLGGVTHAESDGTATRQHDIEQEKKVQEQFREEMFGLQREHADSLYASADRIRAIADALLAGRRPPAPGWKAMRPLLRGWKNPRVPSVPATLDLTLDEYFTATSLMGLLSSQAEEPNQKWCCEWSFEMGRTMAREARKRRR